MQTIKYIGFYPKDKNGFSRHGSIAAANKMDYICSSVNVLGTKVEIISPSWFSEKKRKPSRKYTIEETETKKITFGPSFSAKNRIFSRVRALFSMIWLFFFLIKHTEKDEYILVYHSLMLAKPIQWAKKLKKFKLVLEANEIYSDVKKFSKRIERLEYKMFNSADKYIYSTELLNEKLNKYNKPYIINSGTYHVEEDRKCRFDDGKIHVVYAGIIDSQKGATTAVETAAYLNSNYHIHIIGFGSDKDKMELKKLIDEITCATECKVTFDGLKQGEEYIEFLQKCDVGLTTQSLHAAYNETSFPSKLLSYLSNGLRVVSIKIKSIEESQVSDLINYYDVDSPEHIANAIKSINFSKPYDSRKRIKELNHNFSKDIGRLLNLDTEVLFRSFE